MSTSGEAARLSVERPELRIEVRRYDDPVVTELVRQLQQIFVQRYGGPDEAVVDPVEFSPPLGLFLVGFVGDEAVASGGWRLQDEPAADQSTATQDPGRRTAEIKRMYVIERMQRRGLSRLMLSALEESARQAGVSDLVLNTGAGQPEAIALYLSSGYVAVPGFGVYAAHPGAHFYGKSL
ncbi:acetyltransferase (GNAT) family protein [Jatrophihabitans sp. GAS493]|uniref:GNAT family N-acetyltransferase n=1 Tax=Jatrophihabitans sp. GAS493 TaxID=1907575 RepID=UPI000BB852AC|nr:GNAT family N-acetyltransferase [Jatrophihabitans sp. GAS493]SOD73425.1 acetyltransferase (GNAT) family protein [Jatrophihabitans sp. GAS493]